MLAALAWLKTDPKGQAFVGKLIGVIMKGGDKAFVAGLYKCILKLCMEMGRVAAIFNMVKQDLPRETQIALGLMYDNFGEVIDEMVAMCKEFKDIGIDPAEVDAAVERGKKDMMARINATVSNLPSEAVPPLPEVRVSDLPPEQRFQ